MNLKKRKGGQVVKKVKQEPVKAEKVDVVKEETQKSNLQGEINHFKIFNEQLTEKVSNVCDMLDGLDKKLDVIVKNNEYNFVDLDMFYLIRLRNWFFLIEHILGLGNIVLNIRIF